MDVRSPRARAVPMALAAGLATFLAVAPALAAGAQQGEDPNLEQVIDRDQPVVAGPAELVDGHVDIGPRFVDGAFTLLVHDDAEVPSVWRPLDETVLRVGDAAVQTVPDDPTYDFLGVEPGTDVYVVPQIQRDGVVWVGWNTQDPEVRETVDRGATLALVGYDGPGELVVYLQSGALGDPEVLWHTAEAQRQPFWVEANTHTHANWVFTEPGVHLVQVEVSAELISGESVRDVRTLRFAVGDATSAAEARAAAATTTFAASDEPDEGAGAVSGDEGDAGGISPVVVVVAVAALALATAVAVVSVRGGRARRRAEQEHVGAGGRR
ncbi:MAG: choice-of-anchor M domain-containing protein [Acidimicrobiia bacterium]